MLFLASILIGKMGALFFLAIFKKLCLKGTSLIPCLVNLLTIPDGKIMTTSSFCSALLMACRLFFVIAPLRLSTGTIISAACSMPIIIPLTITLTFLFSRISPINCTRVKASEAPVI